MNKENKNINDFSFEEKNLLEVINTSYLSV